MKIDIKNINIIEIKDGDYLSAFNELKKTPIGVLPRAYYRKGRMHRRPIVRLEKYLVIARNKKAMRKFIRDNKRLIYQSFVDQRTFYEYRDIFVTIKEILPDYSHIKPNTILYRVVGQGASNLPSGEKDTGFWTTSKDDAVNILRAQQNECEYNGIPCYCRIIERPAEKAILDNRLHVLKKVNHIDLFDKHEVFVKGWKE